MDQCVTKEGSPDNEDYRVSFLVLTSLSEKPFIAMAIIISIFISIIIIVVVLLSYRPHSPSYQLHIALVSTSYCLITTPYHPRINFISPPYRLHIALVSTSYRPHIDFISPYNDLISPHIISPSFLHPFPHCHHFH